MAAPDPAWEKSILGLAQLSISLGPSETPDSLSASTALEHTSTMAVRTVLEGTTEAEVYDWKKQPPRAVYGKNKIWSDQIEEV